MAITPEDIADRKFLVGLRGYDRDEVRKFLSTVAEDYRAALAGSHRHTNGTSGADRAEDGPSASKTSEERQGPPDRGAKAKAAAPAETSSSEDWARMGEEVAAILRTAHEQVASLKRKAQEEAAEHKRAAEAQAELTKAEAEMYDADVRTKAEAWAESRQSRADAELEEAKHTLANAQNEALSLVADAEKRAARMLQSTERKAKSRADEVLAKARAELAELKQSQEQASQWLVAARTYINQAVETYEASGSNDLSAPIVASVDTDDTDDAADADEPDEEKAGPRSKKDGGDKNEQSSTSLR